MAVALWITLTLTGLHAPVNAVNEQALLAWAASEGMPASSNNPLAASDQIAGATPTPGFSEPSYPSVQAAADLYVAKLESAQYADIGIALKQGTNLQSIYTAINQSPWCAGCQGGHYPAVLWNEVKAAGSTQEPVTPPHQVGGGGVTSGGVVIARYSTNAWHSLNKAMATKLPTAASQAAALRRAALRALK